MRGRRPPRPRQQRGTPTRGAPAPRRPGSRTAGRQRRALRPRRPSTPPGAGCTRRRLARRSGRQQRARRALRARARARPGRQAAAKGMPRSAPSRPCAARSTRWRRRRAPARLVQKHFQVPVCLFHVSKQRMNSRCTLGGLSPNRCAVCEAVRSAPPVSACGHSASGVNSAWSACLRSCATRDHAGV